MTRPEFPANAVNAPCKRENPELFFPSRDAKPSRVDAARAVCTPCPFRDECLSYALRNKVEGVWAATTARERDAIRNKHGIAAEPLSFGTGPTNSSAIKRMWRRGTGMAEIAERLGVTYESVRLVIRADEKRRESEGRPLIRDPKTPVTCDDCGRKMLPVSLRKHTRDHCPAREQVAS